MPHAVIGERRLIAEPHAPTSAGPPVEIGLWPCASVLSSVGQEGEGKRDALKKLSSGKSVRACHTDVERGWWTRSWVVRWYTPRISHIDMNVSDSRESGLGTVKGPPL